MENLLARGAINLCSIWFSPVVLNCFSCRAVVSLCKRDWHSSLSAGLLYKGRANGLVKW